MHLLGFGLKPDLPEDALCLRRVEPMFSAFRQATDSFHSYVRRHNDLLGGENMRPYLADLIDSDMQSWASTCVHRIAENSDPSAPPSRFEQFSQPPLVQLKGVTSFVQSEAFFLHLFRASCSSDGEGDDGGGGHGHEVGHDSGGRTDGKRKSSLTRADNSKRSRPFGVCWEWWSEGVCERPACNFPHTDNPDRCR